MPCRNGSRPTRCIPYSAGLRAAAAAWADHRRRPVFPKACLKSGGAIWQASDRATRRNCAEVPPAGGADHARLVNDGIMGVFAPSTCGLGGRGRKETGSNERLRLRRTYDFVFENAGVKFAVNRRNGTSRLAKMR